jgi:hypothetical protein
MDWVERCDKEAAELDAVISRIGAQCDAGAVPKETREALLMLKKRLDTLREFVINEVSAMHDAQLLRGWSDEEAKLIAEMDPFRLSVQGDGL